MRRWMIIFTAVAGLAGASRAAERPAVPFVVGEKLFYRVSWGVLPVGEASLEVRGIEKVDGHDCYHLVAKAGTSGLGRALFPLDSVEESWLDREGLFSRKFTQDHREGRRVQRSSTRFDYDQKQIITTNLKNGREQRAPLDGPVQDVISSLYYARSRPLALDQEQTLVVHASETNYTVTLRPDQRRQLSVRPVGDVPALRIEPKPTLRVVSAHNGRMWFWMGEDARRLPLLLTSSMSIGNARMVLYKLETPGIPQYTAVPAKPAND